MQQEVGDRMRGSFVRIPVRGAGCQRRFASVSTEERQARQQPTGKRVLKQAPSWMYKIPAGVREFIGVIPFFGIAYLFADYFQTFLPNYHEGPGRETYGGPPSGGFHLEPIRDSVSGKVVAYRHVKHASEDGNADG